MAKRKEEPAQIPTREDRIAQRMTDRVEESRKAEAKYEATLDPRQFQA